MAAWIEKLQSWLAISHYAKVSGNPISSTAPFQDASHWIPDLHHQLTVLEFRWMCECSLPKFALASGTYLYFSGLVNCTHCVLSRDRQHALSVHRMLEQEEGLATAAHSFHRCKRSSYQRLWKTCLVGDLGNTNVICVGQCWWCMALDLSSQCAPSQLPFPVWGSLLHHPHPLALTPTLEDSSC